MRQLLKTLGLLLLTLFVVTAGPILYVETSCRGTALPQAEPIYITAADDRRAEARTYLTYPEWHIVYAYEGYAEAIRTGKPHQFAYGQAITGFWTSLCALTFWTSLCALTKKADSLGAAGFDAKSTIYTIGASFTLEMMAKALYEHSIGRMASWLGTSPQGQIEVEMAAEYAKFLQQTPWYKFDFDGWAGKLWATPTASVRAHERRFALGIEWKVKAAYARLITKAVAGVGPDELTMNIAVTGVEPATLTNAELVETIGDVTILNVPRYRVFTDLVAQIVAQGGTILEIAGNDDTLVSMILKGGDFYEDHNHILLSRNARVGFSSNRILLAVKTTDLHHVFTGYPNTPIRVEHIYDY